MSAMNALKFEAPEPRTRIRTAFQTYAWADHTAQFTVHWGRTGAVVAARGEIDAANADPLIGYFQQYASRCEWLILDLSALEFLGTAGFSSLQAINNQCAQTKIHWLVVPGTAVSRLLRVCDPEAMLPTAQTLTAALAEVQNPQRLLHSVPRPVPYRH